jgi:hypothetical protein
MIGPFVGEIHSQTVPAASKDEPPIEPKVLEDRFTGFLERSQRLTRRVRMGVGVTLVVPLAFIASRMDEPLAVGLCGLLILVPGVWASTAFLVPLVLMGRAKLADGGALTMQAGVPIAVDGRGLSAGETSFAWAAVMSVKEEHDAVVVRGVDVRRRVVFQVLLTPKNFASPSARADVRVALEALRAAAQ